MKPLRIALIILSMSLTAFFVVDGYRMQNELLLIQREQLKLAHEQEVASHARAERIDYMAKRKAAIGASLKIQRLPPAIWREPKPLK